MASRDDWTFKEVIERESGKVHRLYWYRGKVCKRLTLDTPIARQLAGYVLIEKDLWSAGIWLSEIDRIRGDNKTLEAKGSHHAADRERYNIVKEGLQKPRTSPLARPRYGGDHLSHEAI